MRDATSREAMLLEVIRIVRNHPDFDEGGPMADMMDEALAGKSPKLVSDVDRLSRGLKPFAPSTAECTSDETPTYIASMASLLEDECVTECTSPRAETRCPQCGTVHPRIEQLERALAEAQDDADHWRWEHRDLEIATSSVPSSTAVASTGGGCAKTEICKGAKSEICKAPSLAEQIAWTQSMRDDHVAAVRQRGDEEGPGTWMIEAILRSLQSLQSASGVESGWQPIDTAPKTGPVENLLLYVPALHGTGGPVIAHWAEGGGEEQPPFGPAWFFWTGFDFRELSHKPTHWMRLPHCPADWRKPVHAPTSTGNAVK